MFSRGTRSGGSSSTPPPSNGGGPSSPRKRSKSPETYQMAVSPSAQSSAPSSLNSSMAELGVVASYSSPALGSSSSSSSPSMNGVVTRSYESIVRESQSLEERYHNAIVPHRYWQRAQANALSSSVSRLLLHGRTELLCNEMMSGLVPLKQYCAANIQRMLIDDPDPRRSALSRTLSPNAMCTLVAQSGSGVRSYCQFLCEELMIDLYVVGNMLYEPGMMKDLLREAEASGRALILFDQTQWFSTREYDHRGVSFIQQLTARIASRAAENAQRHLGAAGGGACASLQLFNSLEVPTLGNTIPNLWVIISTPTSDIHPTVVELSHGWLQLNEANEEVAFNAARGALKKYLRDVFDETQIEMTFSQTAYLTELQNIGRVLKNHSIGNILRVMDAAYRISFLRSFATEHHGQVIDTLLPTAQDVELAAAQLSGQALGGISNAVATRGGGQSAAAAAAAYGNEHYGRRT